MESLPAARSIGDSAGYSHLLRRRRSHDDVSIRMRVGSAKYLAMAKTIAQGLEVDVDAAWVPIAWSIDIVLHILQEQRAGRRDRSVGMPLTFFSAAHSINVTVAGRAVCGAEKLYHRYETEMVNHLTRTVLPAVRAKHGEAKLQEFRSQWEQHKVTSEFMRRFFDIVDRGYVAQSEHMSLSAIALQKFKEILFDATARAEMLHAMLAIVARHRRAASNSPAAPPLAEDDPSCRLLKQCSEIFCTLGVTTAPGFNLIRHWVVVKRGQYVVPPALPLLPASDAADARAGGGAPPSREIYVQEHLRVYRDDYERPLLVASLAHFEALANERFAGASLVEYMELVQRTLRRERARVDRYFHATTKEKLVKLVLQAMVAEPRQTLLLGNATSGLARLLDGVVDEAQLTLGESGRSPAAASVALVYSTVSLIQHDDAPWVLIDPVSPEPTLAGGHTPMAKLVGAWMLGRGLAFVEARKKRIASAPHLDTNDAVEMIDGLIAFHNVCKSLVRMQFKGRPIYRQQMRHAWEHIVNPASALQGSFDMPQLLAGYFDTVLRGHKAKTRLLPPQQTDICSSAVELWDYLSDKLLFIETHAELLMHRLLKTSASGRYLSDHGVEKAVILQLKAKHAAQYTVRVETMFADLEAGEGTREKFERYCENVAASALNRVDAIVPLGKLKVKLISRSAWPLLPGSAHRDGGDGFAGEDRGGGAAQIRLPPLLESTRQRFREFYDAEHMGEKCARFHTPLSFVVIKLALPKCTALVTMATTQCAILALFRVDRMVLTFQQLLEGVKCDSESLQCALEVLLRKPQHCNGGFLLKAPKAAAILPTDKFKFNRKFQCKVAKLAPLPSTLREDTGAAADRAYEKRQQYLYAAIVRTLKARREIRHRELVVEVTQQIKLFAAQPRNIKRALESLIGRKYVERHPTAAKTYRYLG